MYQVFDDYPKKYIMFPPNFFTTIEKVVEATGLDIKDDYFWLIDVVKHNRDHKIYIEKYSDKGFIWRLGESYDFSGVVYDNNRDLGEL